MNEHKIELEDSWKMPFGKYKDVPIGDVPSDYLDWLDGQDWIDKYPHIQDYIQRNRLSIDADLKRKGRI